MIAIPALDIRDGACVQLVGGSYAAERIRIPDPAGVARAWTDAGFTRMHVVDLDAATGRGSNERIVRDLISLSDILVQVGGGIFRQDPNVSGKYMETINWVPVGGNYGHYTNTRLDELFPKGRSTADLNQRKQIYTEAATIMNDELPWIYLWSPNSIFAVSKRLVGFKPPSYATHNMWNADEWTVSG